MTINGQSGAGMLDMFKPAAPVARQYLIQCPPCMLADGHRIKRFTSLEAFEGYIAELRSRRMTVHWNSPFTATVEPSV
ncbi:hypothetical protein AcdelDRAFT_1341 [Acidovorax delafieldii 2AN]|uniref:Uncharacterized protein n=1 Tax=Acidovorax delafieldii 2AN TaxID=573060 RepID=C5T361_ACIDE|nr:hypothetical protein [Acidovorax delafieldii]EER61084.1 hypothetical protein AcdelDRAFT_1341 [Acidovorax delafieldii 2AN]